MRAAGDLGGAPVQKVAFRLSPLGGCVLPVHLPCEQWWVFVYPWIVIVLTFVACAHSDGGIGRRYSPGGLGPAQSGVPLLERWPWPGNCTKAHLLAGRRGSSVRIR